MSENIKISTPLQLRQFQTENVVMLTMAFERGGLVGTGFVSGTVPLMAVCRLWWVKL